MTVRNEKGEVVGIHLITTNFGEFQEYLYNLVLSLEEANAAKQVGVLVPGFFDMAYTDMRHRDTGLLFDQLS